MEGKGIKNDTGSLPCERPANGKPFRSGASFRAFELRAKSRTFLERSALPLDRAGLQGVKARLLSWVSGVICQCLLFRNHPGNLLIPKVRRSIDFGWNVVRVTCVPQLRSD